MLSYRGRVRLGINVDKALVESEEVAHHILEDAVLQITSLLMDLRTADVYPDSARNASEFELLLNERARSPSPDIP